MQIKLSFAICTFNRDFFLNECLYSLHVNNINDFPFEVIVIDNNSNDDTKTICDKFCSLINNFKYIHESNIGLSYARNKALNSCNSNYIGYLDDDIKISNSFLKRLEWLISNIDFDCIGGMFYPWYLKDKPNWFKDYLVTEEHFLPSLGILEDDYITGLNIIFKTHTLSKLGGFPINFGMKGNTFNYGEEDFVQKQIRDDGGKIFFDPELYVYHAVQNYKLSLLWQLMFIYKSSKAAYIINQKENILLLIVLFIKSFLGLLFKRIPKGIINTISKNDYFVQNLFYDAIHPLVLLMGKIHGCINLKISKHGQ